jgi:hypothetical protein
VLSSIQLYTVIAFFTHKRGLASSIVSRLCTSFAPSLHKETIKSKACHEASHSVHYFTIALIANTILCIYFSLQNDSCSRDALHRASLVLLRFWNIKRDYFCRDGRLIRIRVCKSAGVECSSWERCFRDRFLFLQDRFPLLHIRQVQDIHSIGIWMSHTKCTYPNSSTPTSLGPLSRPRPPLSTGSIDDFYSFDPTTLAWTLLSAEDSARPSARSDHGFTSDGYKLYVHGGYSNGARCWV